MRHSIPCLLGLALMAAAGAKAQPCVEVEVQGVRAHQGHLMVSAFVDEASYSRRPAQALRLPAGEATMKFKLCGLSGDEVALLLFQDLDKDGRLARNVLGLPTEPWGASGSPGRMGPQWASTRQPLDGQPLLVRMSQ